MKRTLAISTALLAATLFHSPAYAGESVLVLKDFIGRVTVETRKNAELKITRESRAKDVDVESRRDSLTLDGGFSNPDGSKCKGYNGKITWSLFSKKEKTTSIGGYEDIEDYPLITISAPDDVTLVIENSIIFGSAGNIGTADIDVSDCGKFDLGDISGPARFDISGSGDLTAKNIGALVANVSGSGDLEFRNVTDADISVSGSGDVEFKDAQNVNLSVSGSGDVEMEDIAEALNASASGSGDISARSVGQDLIYEASGSSDLDIDDAFGRAFITLSGSSDVEIDGGKLDMLSVKASGGSEISIDADVIDAELYATGHADIYIDRASGKVTSQKYGGGDIHVGN